MLFGSDKSVILFADNVIQLHVKEKGVAQKLVLSQASYFAQEIIDPKKFETELLGFIKKVGISAGDVGVILGEHNYFYVSHAVSKSSQDAPDIKDVLASVPIASVNRLEIVQESKEGTRIFIANKHVISVLTSVLEKAGLTLRTVLPVEPFGKATMGLEVIEKAMNGNAALVRKYNFLGTNAESEMDEEPESTSQNDEDDSLEFNRKDSQSVSKKQVVVFVCALIAMLGLALYAVISTDIIQIPFLSKGPTPQQVKVSISPSPSQIPSPSVAPIAKEDTTIAIFNASGIVGQAGKVKLLLEKNDYTNITTDTASAEGTIAKVQYVRGIPADARTALEKILNEFFSKIEPSTTATGPADIVIYTGPEK